VHTARNDVVQVQNRLRQLGYTIAPDGRYGRRTAAAVRDYQSKHGLVADGIVGPRTWASLLG
jgi:peptidoglycan hydrolase-like protein with peptidoglycan-binding domain